MLVRLFLEEQQAGYYGSKISKFEKVKSESDIQGLEFDSTAYIFNEEFSNVRNNISNQQRDEIGKKFSISSDRYWGENGSFVVEISQDDFGRFVYIFNKLDGGAYMAAE